MTRKWAFVFAILMALDYPCISQAYGQAVPTAIRSRLTVAVLGSEEHSSMATEPSFWRPGVVLQVQVQPPRHLGYALELAASKENGLGTEKTDIEVRSAALGVTYLWQPTPRFEVFSRAMGGLVRSASNGRFISSASYAGGIVTGGQMQVGGGLDLRLPGRFSLRLAEADYEHYFLPTNATNLRTDLRLSAGIVVRLF